MKLQTEIAERLEEIYNVEFNQAEITFITIHLRGAKRKRYKRILILRKIIVVKDSSIC